MHVNNLPCDVNSARLEEETEGESAVKKNKMWKESVLGKVLTVSIFQCMAPLPTAAGSSVPWLLLDLNIRNILHFSTVQHFGSQLERRNACTRLEWVHLPSCNLKHYIIAAWQTDTRRHSQLVLLVGKSSIHLAQYLYRHGNVERYCITRSIKFYSEVRPFLCSLSLIKLFHSLHN